MNLAPLPWSIQEVRTIHGKPYSGFVYLVDANGAKIAVLYGRPAAKEALADFILSAAADEANAPMAPALDDKVPATP
jgi:hypothetical protein